jgi:hypothetical protein
MRSRCLEQRDNKYMWLDNDVAELVSRGLWLVWRD